MENMKNHRNRYDRTVITCDRIPKLLRASQSLYQHGYEALMTAVVPHVNNKHYTIYFEANLGHLSRTSPVFLAPFATKDSVKNNRLYASRKRVHFWAIFTAVATTCGTVALFRRTT